MKLKTLTFLFGVLVMAGPGCSMNDMATENIIRLGTLHFTNLSGLSPDPGDTVQMEAHVTGSYYSVRNITWSILDADSEAQEFTTSGAQEQQIAFVVSKLGTYLITATARYLGTSDVLIGTSTVILEDPSVEPLNYTVRIIPPPGQFLPAADLDVQVGAVNHTNLTWQVNKGKEVQLTVRDGSLLAPLNATVQLIYGSADPLPMEWWLSGGIGTLHLGSSFFPLFLPDDDQVAPLLLPEQFGAQLPGEWVVDLPAGTEITGMISDPSGPLAGAYVTLHTRAFYTNLLPVPSTGGRTGADGSFAIRTQVFEQYSPSESPSRLIVVPPEGAALIAAEVAGLNPAKGVTGWRMIFDPPSSIPVTGTIMSSDLKSPAVAATVKLRLEPAPVGRLEIGEDTFEALGQYSLTLTTDSKGALVDLSTGANQLQLPEGVYSAEIWPGPLGGKEEGYRKVSGVQVAGEQPVQLDFSLTPRRKIMGQVLDNEGELLPNAQVVATSEVDSFTGTTDELGFFELEVDDLLTYSLFIRADRTPTGKKLGSYYLDTFTLDGGDRQVPAILLPRAVTLSGWVKTSDNISVGGALLRVWCSSVSCGSHQILDETQTRPDGSFEVRVPRSTVQP